MSICSVCGQNVKNVNCNIVKGKSGEWVCKSCLKKANIGVMKFSSQNITSGQIMAIINGETPPEQPQASLKQVSPATSGMHCPKCKSTDLQIISDVQGKGVSGTQLCLCGILGLAGAGKTKTTHYWVCKNCGNRFKL